MRSWISWLAITSARMQVTSVAAIAMMVVAVFAATADADPAEDSAKEFATKSGSAEKDETPTPPKLGVLVNDADAFAGYNLINPNGKKTYLFDNNGRVVHTWTSELSSGAAVYLLENGHLFRPAEAVNRNPRFKGPAVGGRLQEFDWDGNLVWDFEYHSAKRLPHHDAIKLPNGNALLICWEMIEEEEAVAQGRRPETVKDAHLQPDCLVEIKPTGEKTGEIVWEWRSWDHLIQDRDNTKPNYGKVSKHPERFDVNYIRGDDDRVAKPLATKDVADQKTAAAKGQPKDAPKKDQPPRKDPDWMHVNAVAYNADLDQIVLSSPNFCEIWIIDHGTTTEEARGHTGGRWGKGGDILYRWGNPRVYRNGTKLDQRLFFQHNIQWIPKGLRGAGHLLVFNNGSGRTPEEYSAVDEFAPPTDSDGNYTRGKLGRFGPEQALWSYSAPHKKDFFSWFISGAQRLPNGNTLINAGATGIVFEVTPENETVWKFANPIKNPARATPGGGPLRPFEAVPPPTRDALDMNVDQRKQLDAIDKELNAKLEKVLTVEEWRMFTEPSDIDVSKIPAGEYLAAFKSTKLKLTEAQTKGLQTLQQEFDPKIAKILTDDQKRTLEDLKKKPATAGAGGGRKPGNTLFRATRYGLDYPAFQGKRLTPGKTLLEIQQELDERQPNQEARSAKPMMTDASR
jgi:hypothetical protein